MPQGKGFLLACLLAASLWASPAASEEKKNVVLLTLEWPPYTSVKLPDNGLVSKRVKMAYAARGQNANIGFYSWRRAIRMPYTDRRFAGVFPAYPSAERKQVCHFSDPIGSSALGLAQTARKPLQWLRTEDLKRYRLGIVTAYANEESLDKLIREGSVKTRATETDADNLLNLVRGRVDAAVIDATVFNWLMQNDARLRPWRDKVQMNERLLVTWPLFVCFRKDAEGAVQRDEFNAGLATLHDSELGMPPAPATDKPAKTKTRGKAP